MERESVLELIRNEISKFSLEKGLDNSIMAETISDAVMYYSILQGKFIPLNTKAIEYARMYGDLDNFYNNVRFYNLKKISVARTQNPIYRALLGEKVSKEQYYVRDRDKEYAFEINIAPITSEENELVSIVICQYDITDFINNQKEIEKKNEMLFEQNILLKRQSNLLSHSSDAIITCLFDFTIIDWNIGAVDLYGYSAEEVIGQNVYTLLCTNFLDDYNYMCWHLFSQKMWAGEIIEVDKNGKVHKIRSLIELIIPSDGDKLILIRNRDVSDSNYLCDKTQKGKIQSIGYKSIDTSNPLDLSSELDNILNIDTFSIDTIMLLEELNRRIIDTVKRHYPWITKFINLKQLFEMNYGSIFDTQSLKASYQYVIEGLVLTIRKFEFSLQNNGIIKKACNFILENVDSEITLTIISEQLFITKSYLSKLFREKTGVKFNDYITFVKIERAKALLSDKTIRISDIAEKLAYKDIEYFSKLFKKNTGLTPSDYRMLGQIKQKIEGNPRKKCT